MQTRGERLLARVNAKHIEGLDFVRAVSVCMVLVAHGLEAHPAVGMSAAPLASLGVEAFFVLSGFLITRLLLDEVARTGRVGLLGFYRRRAARLMPVFLAFGVVVISILLLRGKPVPWPDAGAAFLYVVNYYQAFTGAPDNAFSHCWSLSVEEQFYLLWPLALGFFASTKRSLSRALVALILAVWAWRLVLVFGFDCSPHYLYRALDTRADELAMGCLVSVLMREPRWRDRLTAVAQAPGAALLMTVGVFVSASIGYQSKAFNYCVGFMIEPILLGFLILWVIGASGRPGWPGWLLKNSVVTHIGKVSYGLYLLHGLVAFSVHQLLERRTGNFALGFVGGQLALLIVATISFRWFETPARKWIAG